MKRRSYLTTASVIAATAVAGCMGGNPDGGDAGTETGGSDETHTGDENGDTARLDRPDLVGTFDTFENLEAWEVVVGTLEADGETVFEGSQSARLVASETDPQVRIKRELDEPIDVSDVVPGLALSTSSVGNPVIQLQDADGNFLQYQQHVRESQPFVRHNFGHTAVSGNPNLNAITEIHVSEWTGDESASELWIDDLHFVPRIDTGRVLVQFQGGFETDYTRGFPIMEAYGLTGSTFLATARIREHEGIAGDRMTEAQVADLVNAGWSLGTVGARGQQLHRVESDRIESDIRSPLEWFDERGYDDANYFAFPGGRYDRRLYDLVAAHYDLGFAGRYRSQGVASNRLTLTRISGEVGQRNLDAEQLIDALDWTAEHGGLTTITFYEMDADDATALEEMASHLATLETAGDLELITPAEIASEYVH